MIIPQDHKGTGILPRSLLLLLFLFIGGLVQTTALAADTVEITTEEAAVWNSIKDTGNVDVLKAFLKSYPNGTFALIAKSLIDVLEAKQATPTTAIQTSDQERVLWNSVKAAKTPADLQPYLDAFPNGRYAALARARMITLAAAEVVPAPPSEPAAETAALVVPEKEINPFDGKWRLSGAAHSFKRYRGGICQNPDSLNDSFVITDGRIDDVLRSKTRNTVAVEGEIDPSGQLSIDFRSKNHGWDYTGKASTKVRKNASTIRLHVRLQGASQSGCRYDFTMRRVQ